MRTLISLIAFFLILINPAFSQGFSEKYPENFKQAKAIDEEKDYEVATLENNDFLCRMTDGGGELSGYFMDDHLMKMEARIHTSLGIRTFRYYFSRGRLFYINEFFEQFSYEPATDTINYSETELTFNGHYIFRDEKLSDYETLGHNRFEDEEIDPAEILLVEAKKYKQLLKQMK